MNRPTEAKTPGVLQFKYLFPICCAIAFLIPIAACTGLQPARISLALLRAPDFLFLLLWLAAALGFWCGDLRITGAHRSLDGLLRLVTATATGLGFMSLLVMGLGLCVHLGTAIAWGILVAGWISGVWARDVLTIKTEHDSEAKNYRWLLLLCAAALGMACVSALLPPGVLWGDEPNGYDVLEYHLQLPREWYELGRIVQLKYNVFSYFPLNVEMHFMLAMSLCRGPWAGMYLAQLMHVAFIALTVTAIYALVSERSKPMAAIAATLAATVPWLGLLAPIAYDEGGLLLWGTLAIGLSLRRPGEWRSMVLAGVMAGFACGSKLTAVPIVLIATPLVHLILHRRWGMAAASYLVAGVIIFSPWLVKDFAWTGNPFFPEATSIFGKAHWNDQQVQRWNRANHLPRPEQQNLAGRAAALWNQVIGDWRFGYVLLPLAIIAAVMTFRDRQTITLLLILSSFAGFWFFFTHLQSRFLTLAIPIAALLIGQLKVPQSGLRSMAVVAVIAGSFGVLAVFTKLNAINPHLFDFVGVSNLEALTPLTTPVPENSRLILIGDGRPFLYDVPSGLLFYRTVFDVAAMPGETSDEAWRRDSGSWGNPPVTVIDAPELRRFAQTYFGIPEPSAEVMQSREAIVR